jgi:hypothetical protein
MTPHEPAARAAIASSRYRRVPGGIDRATMARRVLDVLRRPGASFLPGLFCLARDPRHRPRMPLPTKHNAPRDHGISSSARQLHPCRGTISLADHARDLSLTLDRRLVLRAFLATADALTGRASITSHTVLPYLITTCITKIAKIVMEALAFLRLQTSHRYANATFLKSLGWTLPAAPMGRIIGARPVPQSRSGRGLVFRSCPRGLASIERFCTRTLATENAKISDPTLGPLSLRKEPPYPIDDRSWLVRLRQHWALFAQLGGSIGCTGNTAHQNYADLDAIGSKPPRECKPVHRPWHLHVAEHDVHANAPLLQDQEGLVSVGSFDHLVAALAQVVGNDVSDEDLILDDKDSLLRRSDLVFPGSHVGAKIAIDLCSSRLQQIPDEPGEP